MRDLAMTWQRGARACVHAPGTHVVYLVLALCILKRERISEGTVFSQVSQSRNAVPKAWAMSMVSGAGGAGAGWSGGAMSMGSGAVTVGSGSWGGREAVSAAAAAQPRRAPRASRASASPRVPWTMLASVCTENVMASVRFGTYRSMVGSNRTVTVL